MLLAHIPMVGAAFSVMLPVIGVIAAIKVIGDLIEKHEKLAEAQRHATEVSETLQIKQNDLVLGLQAANLQLEDQIRKLEGRPATNTLLLAMVAVKRSVDDLVTTYANDFQKMDKVIEDQLGFWANLKRAAMDVTLALDEMAGGEEGETAKRIKSNAEEVAALNGLLAAQEKLDQARRKLADADPSKNLEGWKTAAGAVAIAAGNVQAAADTAHAAVLKVDPDAKTLLGTLSDKATVATGEWRSMALEITKVGLEARKTNQEMANASAEKQAKAAKEALDQQIENIKAWAEEQERASSKAEHGAAMWAAAQVHAADAAAIAHENYLKRLVDIYTRAGEVEKAQEEQAKLDVLVKADQTEAAKKLDDAMKKYAATTMKVREEYAHLINVGVEKEWEKTAEAAKKLTAAEEEMLRAESKLKEDTLSAHYKDQETAITELAQMHLITEQQKDDRLKLLEEEQSKKAIAIIDHEISEIEKKQAEAQSKLSAAKASPTATGSQITELQAELDKQKTALTKTEDQKIQIQEKFNKQSEAHDKSHYGRTLLMAIANGKELLAEQMKQNHAALLAEENELKLAKARGADTTAIHQKITALKQQEQALEKEASGSKAILAADLQLTKTKLLAAQAILAEAKARGLNTTAIEKEITELKKLEAEQKREVQGTHQLQTATQTLRTTMQSSYSEMVTSVSGAMQAMMTGQKSFGAAMEEATFKMLSGMAQKWAEYFMALAIGSWPNFAAMAEYTAAAVAMEALAGALGALGSGSGGGGGGKAQMQGPSVGQTSASTGGGGGSNQTTGVTHLAAGGIVSGPTMAQIGESGPEAVLPLTDPEALASFSRAFTLLSPSTMSAASSAMAPHSTVAASTVAPQIFDEAPMERIAGRNADFGRNESPAAGGGDTHVHNHITIKGSIDHGTIAGLVKKINQGVGNRRLTLNASNSLRVTRRSQ
jgi:hypothetical protein